MAGSKNVRILYMEDDLGLARLVQKRMKRAGYVVDIAEDGKAGLEMFDKGLYDVVALDQSMPGLSGIEVMKILITKNRCPILLMVTGKGSELTAVEAMKLGAGDYIVKDVDGYYLEALPLTIERLLERQRLVEKKQRAEEALQKAHDELELKMNIRTAELKDTNRALRESEELYRTLFEQAGDSLLLVDMETAEIVEFNKKAHQNLGYRAEEFKQLKIADFEASEEKDEVEEHFQKLLKEKSDVFETTHRTKSGEIKNILVTANIISLREKYFSLSILRDITERKQAEEQKNLLQERLRQSQKMESIGTLTGGIAHDFNNILGIIIGNTELSLVDIPEWNPAHASLKEIKSASLRAAGIVKQLLNFTRKTDENLKPIDAITVIKNTHTFLRSMIPATIEIREHFPAMEITILADPIQIGQVLMNICSNASQSMEGSGGLLELAVEKTIIKKNALTNYPDLIPGEYVKIAISDTGPGIDPKIIDRIFDPYFTTKETDKGSGLGLSVVLGIVKNHSGAITVDSPPGKGATFIILFPVITEKPEIKTETTNEVPHGTETILFVDDEKSLVEMTKKMLERLGYKVEAKMNPVEAFDLFHSNPARFDLVITDMTMQQMTGADFSKKLLALRPDIPVIISTGHSSLINEEKAKELGIAAYVMKPIVTQEIATTIRQVLDPEKA